jgi:hypothetical protein
LISHEHGVVLHSRSSFAITALIARKTINLPGKPAAAFALLPFRGDWCIDRKPMIETRREFG